MKFTVRRKLSTLVFSKATVICVLFAAAMVALMYVLWQSRPAEPGTMQDLYTVAAAAPGVGILIAVVSWCAAIWKRSRPIASVGQEVRIRPTGVRFPAQDLGQVTIFSRGEKSFAMLVPRGVTDGQPYTFEFPTTATTKPHQLADAAEATRPDVLVQRLGSMPQ